MNRSQPNCYLPHAGSEQIYEIPAAVQVPASSFDKRNQGQPTTGECLFIGTNTAYLRYLKQVVGTKMNCLAGKNAEGAFGAAGEQIYGRSVKYHCLACE